MTAMTPDRAKLRWRLGPRVLSGIVATAGAMDAASPETLSSEESRHAMERMPMAQEFGEADLLARVRENRAELVALLAKMSSHLGFEDPVYRFYHQSWKVFYLQEETKAIVRALEGLAPGRPLNSWFVQIVSDGTGKTFTVEDNHRWLVTTRPIVEAFFHARFFLEMAVRYATLDDPPNPLPSGYAALLYLYGLR